MNSETISVNHKSLKKFALDYKEKINDFFLNTLRRSLIKSEIKTEWT